MIWILKNRKAAKEMTPCAPSDCGVRLGLMAGILALLFLTPVPLVAQSLIDTPGLNSSAAENACDISDDGRFIVFQSDRPGGAGREDIYLYDRTLATLLSLTRLNSSGPDFSPSISGDGRFIAFGSIRSGGVGQQDIYLYDRQTESLVTLPNLNSGQSENLPLLSSDGRSIVFDASDGRTSNIYIYDRQTATRLAPPQLNTSAQERLRGASSNIRYIGLTHERTGFTARPPSGYFVYDQQANALERLPDGMYALDISMDGRYILAMVDLAVGNTDIQLYDRQEKSFLPLPGLNSPTLESTARMSGDMRYIVFVTFRFGSPPHPEVMLYDRGTRSLVPLPVPVGKR